MTGSGPSLGREVGRGLRSVVQELGSGRVVKIPHPETPARWIRDEWRHLLMAERSGAPSPRSAELVEMSGAVGLSYDHLLGSVMWDALLDDPERAGEVGATLWTLQSDLFGRPASYALPHQRDRLRAKLQVAATAHGLDVGAAVSWVLEQRGSVGLCHGDLHPKNVVLTEWGPVLVDWFDACRGLVAAEVARTTTLLASFAVDVAGDDHGDGAADAVRLVHDVYLDAATTSGRVDPVDVERWEIVQQAGRLAEGLGADRAPGLAERLRSF